MFVIMSGILDFGKKFNRYQTLDQALFNSLIGDIYVVYFTSLSVIKSTSIN